VNVHKNGIMHLQAGYLQSSEINQPWFTWKSICPSKRS